MSNNTTDLIPIQPRYSSVDVVFSALGAGIFIAYNLLFFLQTRLRPDQTTLGFNLKTRHHWVRTMMNYEGGKILAIQCIRNALMSSTFFATTSVGVAFYTSTVAQSSEDSFVQIQMYVLSALLIWSFLHWLVCIKGFTHLGFLICGEEFPCPDSDSEKEIRIKSGINIVANATLNYALGVRGFFASIIVIAWIASPLACLIVSCIITAYTMYSDHSYHHFF